MVIIVMFAIGLACDGQRLLPPGGNRDAASAVRNMGRGPFAETLLAKGMFEAQIEKDTLLARAWADADRHCNAGNDL